MFKNILLFVGCLITAIGAYAQTTPHLVSGSFSEKALAEVMLVKLAGNKSSRIAEFNISPANRNFVFVVPDDLTASYRLQINLMKPNGRHAKLERTCSVPLLLSSGSNYTLKITPSKLDTAKKTGWELKQDAGKSSFALVRGKISNSNFASSITLHSVADGNLVSASSFTTDQTGAFVIPVAVKKPGFYYLSSLRWRVRVYLNPLQKLEVNVDNKTGLMQSVKGSMMTQALYEWQQLIVPVTRYGYNLSTFNIDTVNLDAYIAEYKKLQPAMNEFINNIDMSDAAALRAFKDAMELDRDMAPLYLLYNLSMQGIKGYRPKPKDFKEVPVFYKEFIQPGKFGSTSILALGEAREFMDLYGKLNLAALSKEEKEGMSQVEKLELMMNAISNDTLKSLFFNDQMGQMTINNLSEFKENIEPFKQYAKSGPAKTTYQSIYGMYSGDTAFIGKSSYNFSLPDTSGKMVSMKDFKGKVVFIDVWATWCGPCKAQMPFLKEIEEEYKNNENMVFVGISLDKAKDEQKWKDFVKKEALHGVQLLDADWKSFAKKYGIAAIPRFMLIDKQGKWIEIRCPLPEAKENLKRYLDKALGASELTKN